VRDVQHVGLNEVDLPFNSREENLSPQQHRTVALSLCVRCMAMKNCDRLACSNSDLWDLADGKAR